MLSSVYWAKWAKVLLYAAIVNNASQSASRGAVVRNDFSSFTKPLSIQSIVLMFHPELVIGDAQIRRFPDKLNGKPLFAYRFSGPAFIAASMLPPTA